MQISYRGAKAQADRSVQRTLFKEAIEKKLMTSVRDISRIITKARTRDEDQTQKYNAMVSNLLDE